MTGEKVTESPVFVYKSAQKDPNCGKEKFVSFHADDVAYIEQCWAVDPDSVEATEVTCVNLKGLTTEHSGHLHLQVGFHEIMLRWMSWKERTNVV